MDKQEILKKLEEIIPENDYSGDMILCLNTKDNFPNVYPSADLNYIPQMVGKIQTFGTAQYTMHMFSLKQKAMLDNLAKADPETAKEVARTMGVLVGGKEDA